MNDASESMAAARAAEEAGRPVEAIGHWREALAAEPGHGGALLALARLLGAAGESEAARACLEERLAVAPDDAEAAFHLGTLLLGDGDFDEAIGRLEHAVALAPEVPEVHGNLGAALHQAGKDAQAVAVLERALALRPDFAAALNTLGNARAALGEPEAAIAAYRRAHDLAPNLTEAVVNLGQMQREVGRLDEAMAQFDAALVAVPEHPGALTGVAMVLQAKHDHPAAVGVFRRALAVAPGDPQALNGLAISLQSLRHHREALAIYRDIVAANPGLAVAHANLGHVLQGLGRQAEAAAAFRRALELKPDLRGIRLFLAYAMLHTCDWEDLETVMGAVLAEAEAGLAAGTGVAASPFALAATPASPALRLAVARRAAEACGDAVATEAATLGFMPPRPKDGRLHVGYVSADFRTHSLGLAFREVLRAHDRERFAWHGYSITAAGDDAVAEEFRDLFDGFTDMSALSPAEAARRISGDGVQVLIDLAGHTKDAWLELFHFRPAPVQAHYLGYAEALGAECIPYLISDKVHVPPALARHMGAKMVYLPESFMATARPDAAPEPPSRAACGLPAEGPVFVSFNAFYKLHPAMFEAWMGLLRDVPGSVLWLRAGDEAAMANLRREAERKAIAPERLVFAERLAHADHIARHAHADVALDTLYHGGGVTSADALWAGVPVVSLAGEAASSRIGASLLTALGLPELIASSLDDYAAIARELVTDPDALAALKTKLRANIENEPLFHMDRLARHLESAYERMWARHAAGKRPVEINVPALPR